MDLRLLTSRKTYKSEDRKVKIENGKVILPDIYLPHVQKKMKVKKEDGSTKEEGHWVPILNPAHAFRELGDDESDFVKKMEKELENTI